MKRALELAQKGLGFASPNPLVGCVIVCEGKIIGEGYHQKYGEAHAEVNAIHAVKDKSLLSKSTLYVTLEPCAHYGKTPPCADLIVEHQIPEVFICNTDPFDKVAGKGIEKLEKAGIKVYTGLLEREGRFINRRFFTSIEKKRPYIILKWAQTLDGFIARTNFDSKWISNAYSRKLVHKWRAEEDAILVGYNTARHDNPKLNVRDWEGKDPLRVVLDKNLELPDSHYLFDATIPTICYNQKIDKEAINLIFKKVDFKGWIREVFSDLNNRNIRSIIVEGGSNTLNQLIELGYWDEARVFTGPNKFENGISAPEISARPREKMNIDKDLLEIFLNEEL